MDENENNFPFILNLYRAKIFNQIKYNDDVNTHNSISQHTNYINT